MNRTVDIIVSHRDKLQTPPSQKWSYFNVYFLTELRDLYIVCATQSIENIPMLLEYYLNNNILSENGKKWSKRNLLELANALKKLGLISNSFDVLKGKLFSSKINTPLSDNDKNIFSEIFHSYDRFIDFHNLFRHYDSVMTYKKGGSRFYNRFVVGEANSIEYYIEEGYSEIMRFWDVFLKWGTLLGEYDRCLFKSVGLTSNIKGLGTSWVYKVRKIPTSYSILAFVDAQFGTSYVSIIDLMWEIIRKEFFSIADVKQRLIEECIVSDSYKLQSTSAIYIEEDEKRLLPRIGATDRKSVV